MGSASGIPEALGIYRDSNATNTPHGGIKWGLSHVLKWNYGPKGWMYLKRFETPAEITKLNNIAENNIKIVPNPTKNTIQIQGVSDGIYEMKIFNTKGVEVISSKYESYSSKAIEVNGLKPA